MRTIGRGGLRVSHSEYFSDIGTANFAWTLTANSPYAINPGNESMFPWLTEIAQRFETYQFHMLRFRYEPMVATTVGGAIYMAVDYDSTDPAPTSKLNMLSYKSAVRGPVWESISNHCDLKDLGQIKQRNTLNQPPPIGQDPRLYNAGNLWVAYDSVNPASNGELWVDYDVEFQTPQLTTVDAPTTISLAAGQVASNPLLGAIVSSAAKIPLASVGLDTTGTARLIINKTGQYLYDSVLGTTTTGNNVADIFTGISGVTTALSSALPFTSAAATSIGAVNKTGYILNVTQAPATLGLTTSGLNGGVTLTGSKITIDRLGPPS
jgi:hypothetical protein